MCGTGGNISPRKEARSLQEKRQKGKTTDWLKEKMKTDAMPEMLNGTTYLPFNLLSLSMEINSLDIWKYNQLS